MNKQFFKDREQWLEWRKGGIGASDMSIIGGHFGICDMPSWGDINNLMMEKLGFARPAVNAFMKRGSELEDEAMILTCKELGFSLGEVEKQACFTSPVNSLVRSSIDGWIERGVIIETKVPKKENVLKMMLDDIPSYYKVQMAHQALSVVGSPDKVDRLELYFSASIPEDGLIFTQELSSEEVRKLALEIEKIIPDFWEMLKEFEERYILLKKELEELEKDYLEIAIKMEKEKKAKEVVRQSLRFGQEVEGWVLKNYVRRNNKIDKEAFYEWLTKQGKIGELEKYQGKPAVVVKTNWPFKIPEMNLNEAVKVLSCSDEREGLSKKISDIRKEISEIVKKHGMETYKDDVISVHTRKGSLSLSKLAKDLNVFDKFSKTEEIIIERLVQT